MTAVNESTISGEATAVPPAKRKRDLAGMPGDVMTPRFMNAVFKRIVLVSKKRDL